MPTYTYRCLDCDIISELMSKIEDRDQQSCYECKKALKRMLDKPGMVWSPTRNSGYSF
jgi:putative FmdB family regulatory protein